MSRAERARRGAVLAAAMGAGGAAGLLLVSAAGGPGVSGRGLVLRLLAASGDRSRSHVPPSGRGCGGGKKTSSPARSSLAGFSALLFPQRF